MDNLPTHTGFIHKSDRALAVHKYVWSGNMSEVARLFKVSPAAIFKATKQPWWQEIEAQEIEALREQHMARMRRVAMAALENLEDRIENGDESLDSEGQPRLLKVKARDLAVCYGIVSQNMQKANSQPTLNVNIDLASLAAQFSALATRQSESVIPSQAGGPPLQLPGRGKADPV